MPVLTLARAVSSLSAQRLYTLTGLVAIPSSASGNPLQPFGMLQNAVVRGVPRGTPHVGMTAEPPTFPCKNKTLSRRKIKTGLRILSSGEYAGEGQWAVS